MKGILEKKFFFLFLVIGGKKEKKKKTRKEHALKKKKNSFEKTKVPFLLQVLSLATCSSNSFTRASSR